MKMVRSRYASTCPSASRLPSVRTPVTEPGLRVSTTVSRPGNGRPIDSNVLRPIASTWPIVVSLNHLKSSGKCQGMVLPLPIARLSDIAAMALKGRADIGHTAIGALIDGCGS